eukprot:6098432-Prymnesium_polylepis.1
MGPQLSKYGSQLSKYGKMYEIWPASLSMGRMYMAYFRRPLMSCVGFKSTGQHATPYWIRYGANL